MSMELSLVSLQPLNGQTQVFRKRNRLPVSCGHCRRRKQKCNRANPCEACVRTGDAATCSYTSRGARDDEQTPSSDSREDTLMARIDRLEQLLTSVMANGAQRTPSSAIETLQSTAFSDSPLDDLRNQMKVDGDPNVDQLTGALGVMHVDQAQGKSIYIGGAHWLSIMCQIEEFKSYLAQNHDEFEHEIVKHQERPSEIASHPLSLLRGIASPATREEIFSSLPSREVVERLVNQFFKTYSTNSPFIHEPTFRKECLAHWYDPTKTTIVWLGLLFAIMRLAELSFLEAGADTFSDRHGDRGAVEEYKKRTIQCLIAADYTNPVTYTVETLILYIGSEWLSSQDASIEISLILGMAIRLAMRMGVHRDSNAHPKLTPFQGEMRRRTWAALHEMDVLYSFQLSLPTTIRQSDCDCGFPRNLSDDDFGEETAKLPPQRPPAEATVVSYTISKYRFTLLLGEILALAESRSSVCSEGILKYETALQEALRMTPPHLRISTTGIATTTNMFLIKQRISIDRIYQLSQCVLHRKFLQRAHDDINLVQHRRYCIDAAMALLNHQATIYLECNSIYPQNIKNRHLSTLSTHDFFVAGMAIALDLHYGYKFYPMTANSNDISLWGYDRRAEMITALETSIQFWRICKEYSLEAAKAYGIFSFALMKAKKAQWIIDAQIRGNPEVPREDANQTPMEIFGNQNWMEGIEDQEGFDWVREISIGKDLRRQFIADKIEQDPWNANAADNGDFESLLNWSPKVPDNCTAPGQVEFS